MAPSTDGEHGLAPGTPAVDEVLPSAAGDTVALGGLWRQQLLLLVFYRGWWCLHCQRQMSQLAHEYPRLQGSGVNLVMLSVDSLVRGRQMVEQTQPPFPVLSDRDVDAALAYNVFVDGIALPATFLIDRQGIVQWRYVGKSAADRPTPEVLLQEIARLRDHAPA
jgi:peroxiredoxin